MISQERHKIPKVSPSTIFKKKHHHTIFGVEVKIS